MTLLNINMLKESGSYIGKPVKKQVEWQVKGKTLKADIYVKLSSYETTMEEFKFNAEGQNVLVARILASVCNEKGEPIFTLKDIEGDPETGEGKLCSSLFMALVSAMNQANGYSDEENEEVVEKK